MLRPMGLPEDVQVIAWGLKLERYNCFLAAVGYPAAGVE
jgi:phenylalanyl-tRNA synthetase alpha subunit